MTEEEANRKVTEEDIEAYTGKVMQVLQAEQEIAKIQKLITRLADESNWRDSVKKMSHKLMDNENIELLTPESVAEKIKADAIKELLGTVQEPIDKYIKEILTKKKVPANPPTNK